MNASPDLMPACSACRHCRHYTPEGRRGGQCGQLDALVHGDWKACPLALPAFAPSWESLAPLVPSAVSNALERELGRDQAADPPGIAPASMPLVLASVGTPQQLLMAARTPSSPPPGAKEQGTFQKAALQPSVLRPA